jgi:hypothetical protein
MTAYPHTINYWMSLDGTIKKVSSHRSHAEYVLGHPLSHIGYSDYTPMYKLGYVKIVYEPDPKLWVHFLRGQTLNAKQLKALRELSLERGCKGSFDRIPEMPYKDTLQENYQLAKKLYIDAGKLTADDDAFLTFICNRDYTYKTLADLLLEVKQYHIGWNDDMWKKMHIMLRDYNPNVFPILNFNYDSKTVSVSKQLMESRLSVIMTVAHWPSTAKRNLKTDIRVPRNARQFKELENDVEYANRYLGYLENRPISAKDKVLQKIFSSQHVTFADITNFVEEKPNLLNDKVFTKDELKAIVEKNSYDLKIVYDVGHIVVVDVTGVDGIKAIGCNSLWCFTYGSEYGNAGIQWDHYSYNGHVYAIINFSINQNEPEFIHILTKVVDSETPEDDTGIHDMANDLQYGDQISLLKHLTKTNNIDQIFKFEDF